MYLARRSVVRTVFTGTTILRLLLVRNTKIRAVNAIYPIRLRHIQGFWFIRSLIERMEYILTKYQYWLSMHRALWQIYASWTSRSASQGLPATSSGTLWRSAEAFLSLYLILYQTYLAFSY